MSFYKVICYGLLLSLVAWGAAGSAIASKAKKVILEEGAALWAADGVLIAPDGNDCWSFKLDRDVKDTPAGSVFCLLPSGALENLITDANEQASSAYRIWARVARYKEQNHLFVGHYLPLSKAVVSPRNEQDEDTTPVIETVSTDDDENALNIPAEILNQLDAQREIQTPRSNGEAVSAARTSTPGRNRVLIDRIGYIVHEGGAAYFVLDGLGRGVGRSRWGLLPCRVLELAERRLASQPERIRFKVAGIVTRFRGNEYLLLHKATRVYSYGNFGR